MWRQIEPRNYAYRISPVGLVQSFLIAYALRLSGLRALVARCAARLGTSNFSSLSPALVRDCSLAFVRALVERLDASHRPAPSDLVIVDGMTLSLARTRRHHCQPMNNTTVGGGVVWAYMVRAAKGVCPIQVLRVVQGPWSDAVVMRAVKLIPHGPVYVMDRGFYAFDLFEQWLSQKVHFIVRARANCLRYTLERHLSRARRVGSLRLVLDAWVRLGSAQTKRHPRVRLIEAMLPQGQRLLVVTDQADWSAERILDSYKKRWHIERFHRLLKETLGLAHLYSFSQNGIAFLLYTALLLCLLLFLSARTLGAETITILHAVLRAARVAMGVSAPWKRNSCSVSRGKKRKPEPTTKTFKR
jgi:hypothetical protein